MDPGDSGKALFGCGSFRGLSICCRVWGFLIVRAYALKCNNYQKNTKEQIVHYLASTESFHSFVLFAILGISVCDCRAGSVTQPGITVLDRGLANASPSSHHTRPMCQRTPHPPQSHAETEPHCTLMSSLILATTTASYTVSPCYRKLPSSATPSHPVQWQSVPR